MNVLVAGLKERSSRLCLKMFNLPEDEGGTSEAVRNPATLRNTTMEMGADFYGFCHGIAKDLNWTRCHLGNCGQVDKVSALPSDSS